MKTCYMCSAPKTSKEHVPPDCLFPKDVNYRKNLITVPSCDQHNGHKSEDDLFFLFVMIVHFGNNSIGKDHFNTKIYPAIVKHVATYKRLIGTTLPSPLEKGGKSIEIARDRLDEYASNMGRALYFKVFKDKWLNKIQVEIPSLRYLENGKFFAETLSGSMIASQLLIKSGDVPKGDNPKVFSYLINRNASSSEFACELQFFEDLKIYLRGFTES